jgi:hypothetical protein
MNDNDVWGMEVIENALKYANHEWYATQKNVMHGFDSYNTLVDTPDVTWTGMELNCGWWKVNTINKGIPYCWGRASTIEEYDKGILEGKYAGNVPEDKSRHVSCDCVGVDCSGLLTVCWKLQKKVSTRDIPNIAEKIEALKDIRQGDVFAKIGSHVMLFVEFVNEDQDLAVIIDSTRSTSKVSKREVCVSELFSEGYEIYRKNS